MKTFSLFFLLLTVLSRPNILRSKDLARDVSKFFRPRDSMKMGAVDKNWINVGVTYEKLSPDGKEAALFENRKTNQIYFETKENTWNETEWAETLGLSAKRKEKQLKMIREKDWNGFFYSHVKTSLFKKGRVEPNFAKLLSEMIDVAKCKHSPLIAILSGDHPPNYLEICLTLIDRGADVNALDSREGSRTGKTPLHYAASYGLSDLINVLLKRGAKMDTRAGGWLEITPVHMAAGSGHPNALSLLLQNGAKLENRNLEASQAWKRIYTIDCPSNVPRYNKCIEILVKARMSRNSKFKILLGIFPQMTVTAIFVILFLTMILGTLFSSFNLEQK